MFVSAFPHMLFGSLSARVGDERVDYHGNHPPITGLY
jgi:hypothetical protein